MTRTATFGALLFALLMVTTGLAGVVAATPASGTAVDGTAADASPAPLAQETTTQEDGSETTQEDSETDNESETSEQAETNRSANATASVTFDDQPSNGSVVVVNETNLSAGGFVAILNNSSAVVGNSSYLEPGTHENVTVELDSELAGSQVVVAVPHLDTNDDRAFDYNATEAQEVGPANATDGPYVENGAPGGSTAYVTVGNETTGRESASLGATPLRAAE